MITLIIAGCYASMLMIVGPPFRRSMKADVWDGSTAKHLTAIANAHEQIAADIAELKTLVVEFDRQFKSVG